MNNFWQSLKKPFTVLAPMDDVTDYAFRELIALTAKPDVFFTEFTNTDALMSKGYDATIPRLKFSDAQRPIVAQIWGTNPENFLKSAQLISDMGFDGIDINMGCPVRKVIKLSSGAALVNNQNLAIELIKAVQQGAPNLPVSVKTRIVKTDSATELWLTSLLNQKLSALVLHGRTAKEKSLVPCHWDKIGNAVTLKNSIAPETIFIGNGDVTSYAQVVEKHNKYGVDGVMVGRGVFSNPWVFERSIEVCQHDTKDYIELLKKHLELFHETWGGSKNFEIMKKFFKMYIRDFRGADDLRQSLMLLHKYEEVIHVLETFVI